MGIFEDIRTDKEGNKFYYSGTQKKAFLHRRDGPAIEYANGDTAWYVAGRRHRCYGPAMEKMNGFKAWYTHGQMISNNVGPDEWGVDRRNVESDVSKLD